MDINQFVQTVAIYALPVLFAITLHEAAHGYVARHFGDMTAYAQGRISLNPARHIEIVGTIVVPLLVFLTSSLNFLLGWAKPVPVNYSALRKPRLHMTLVAAAGPAANLVMILAWALVLKLAAALPLNSTTAVVGEIAKAGIFANLILMTVNLLPILPLDGGQIVAGMLPSRAGRLFKRLEPYTTHVLGVLVVAAIVDAILNESRMLSKVFEPLARFARYLIRLIVGG